KTYGLLVLLFIPNQWIVAGILDGTFELDGNPADNSSVAADDWGLLFPTHQAAASDLGRVFIADPRSSSCGDPSTFAGGGSKDDHEIVDWKFTCGKSQDKDEITDAYAALYQQGNDVFLVFGADRYDNS